MKRHLLGAATIVVLLVLWEVLARVKANLYVPPVSQIASTFVTEWISPQFLTEAVPSLWRMALGYALAIVIGAGAGIAIGASPAISRTVDPVLQALRALPAAAVIPVAILMFGIGDGMKVFVIAFGSLFPILVNSADGARSVDAERLDAARNFGFTRAETLIHVIVPSALPSMFAGMRVGLALAFIMIVISEMVGGTNGLGYTILSAQRSFAIPQVYAGVVLLGILGYAMNAGFSQLERRAIGWHRAQSAQNI